MPIKQRVMKDGTMGKRIEVYEEQLELEYTKAFTFTKLDCATKQPKIWKRFVLFRNL